MNRAVTPHYVQPTNLALKFPKEVMLANGARLFWIEDVKDDSVKLDIEWRAGSKYQPKKLVANFANKLLLSGNESHSSADIANKIDFYGGFFNQEIDRDHAGVTLYGLRDNIENIFNVFSESIMECTFPEKDFEKERSVARMRFLIDGKKVKTVCRRGFNKAIFGAESEYGQLAEIEDFDAIRREDVKRFYADFYLNGTPTIFIVGRLEPSFLNRLNEWTERLGGNTLGFEPAPLIQQTGRIDLPIENALQSAIRLGRLMFDKSHPDYFKFQLLNTALGGYFGSRLMNNIREDKGYTYGISSSMSVMESAAYFHISTEVGVNVREAAIAEIYKELDLLRTIEIGEDELGKVKNYMLGDFLRHADGPIAMMENFKNIHFNRLQPTYYTDFIKAVNEANAAELRILAQKYFNPEDLILVTAG